MADPIPVLTGKIDDLFERAREATDQQQQVIDQLMRAVALKDPYGVKQHVYEMLDQVTKLLWVAAQLDALRNIPIDMPRRRSSLSMQAVQIPPALPPPVPLVIMPKKDDDAEE